MSQKQSLLDAPQVTRAAYDDTTGSFSKGCWSLYHAPGAAAQATISKPTAVGVTHICNSITASLAASGTAQTPVNVYLRDGATGVGAILWAAALSSPANQAAVISFSGLNITGTPGNPMTLEFAAAGVAGSVQAVTLTGWDAT